MRPRSILLQKGIYFTCLVLSWSTIPLRIGNIQFQLFSFWCLACQHCLSRFFPGSSLLLFCSPSTQLNDGWYLDHILLIRVFSSFESFASRTLSLICILDNKEHFSLIFYPVTNSPSFTVLKSHLNEIVNICEKRILIIKHMLCSVTVKHRVDCRTDHLVFSPFQAVFFLVRVSGVAVKRHCKFVLHLSSLLFSVNYANTGNRSSGRNPRENY